VSKHHFFIFSGGK